MGDRNLLPNCTIFQDCVLYKMEVWTFLDLKLYRHFEMPIAVACKSTLSASNPLGDATHPVYMHNATYHFHFLSNKFSIATNQKDHLHEVHLKN